MHNLRAALFGKLNRKHIRQSFYVFYFLRVDVEVRVIHGPHDEWRLGEKCPVIRAIGQLARSRLEEETRPIELANTLRVRHEFICCGAEGSPLSPASIAVAFNVDHDQGTPSYADLKSVQQAYEVRASCAVAGGNNDLEYVFIIH